MSFKRRIIRVSAAFAAAAVLAPMVLEPAAAAVPAPGAAASGSGFAGGCVADDLAPALINEISGLPKAASSEDFEAAIVYRLSQDHCAASEVSVALDSLSGMPGANPLLRKAVSNVRLALLSRRLRRGTAAIDGSSGVGFSPAVVSIGGGGGGSSNYPR